MLTQGSQQVCLSLCPKSQNLQRFAIREDKTRCWLLVQTLPSDQDGYRHVPERCFFLPPEKHLHAKPARRGGAKNTLGSFYFSFWFWIVVVLFETGFLNIFPAIFPEFSMGCNDTQTPSMSSQACALLPGTIFGTESEILNRESGDSEKPHPNLPFLAFSVKSKENYRKSKDSSCQPNPKNPWERREKRSKKQGIPCEGKKQGIPKS